MFWHIDTDIVSLIVIAALYVNYYRMLPAKTRTVQDYRFLRCMQLGVLVTVIDIAASVIMDVPVNQVLYHALMTLYFLSIELVFVEWILYAISILYHQDAARGKVVARLALYVYFGYAVLVLSNPWTGLIFTFGKDMIYARGPWFFLMVLVYAIYAIALFAMLIARRREIPAGYPGTVLLLCPIILSVCIAVQLLIPGWLMILPGYMICLVLADLFLQDVRARKNRALMQNLSKAALTDPMTGLRNRAGMEYFVQQSIERDFGKTCLVTVVDLDGLKKINDAMGHPVGDMAILAVAEQLRMHFEPEGVASRFGGDEFVTYTAGDIDEMQAYGILRRLQDALSTLRVGEARVPVRCSVGAVLGLVEKDSFDTLCHRADAALYHVKRRGRNGYAFYQQEMDEEFAQAEAGAAAPQI